MQNHFNEQGRERLGEKKEETEEAFQPGNRNSFPRSLNSRVHQLSDPRPDLAHRHASAYKVLFFSFCVSNRMCVLKWRLPSFSLP